MENFLYDFNLFFNKIWSSVQSISEWIFSSIIGEILIFIILISLFIFIISLLINMKD